MPPADIEPNRRTPPPRPARAGNSAGRKPQKRSVPEPSTNIAARAKAAPTSLGCPSSAVVRSRIAKVVEPEIVAPRRGIPDRTAGIGAHRERDEDHEDRGFGQHGDRRHPVKTYPKAGGGMGHGRRQSMSRSGGLRSRRSAIVRRRSYRHLHASVQESAHHEGRVRGRPPTALHAGRRPQPRLSSTWAARWVDVARRQSLRPVGWRATRCRRARAPPASRTRAQVRCRSPWS